MTTLEVYRCMHRKAGGRTCNYRLFDGSVEAGVVRTYCPKCNTQTVLVHASTRVGRPDQLEAPASAFRCGQHLKDGSSCRQQLYDGATFNGEIRLQCPQCQRWTILIVQSHNGDVAAPRGDEPNP